MSLSSLLALPVFFASLYQWAFHLPFYFVIIPLHVPFLVCCACLFPSPSVWALFATHRLPGLTSCVPLICCLDFDLPLCLSHILPSSCLHRMSPALAWTLTPSVTCGKSFLRKWKENVLWSSPLTGKRGIACTHLLKTITEKYLVYLLPPSSILKTHL